VAAFKNDVLWKPLLRKFRRYLREEALSRKTYDAIHNHAIYAKKSLLYAEALELPAELIQQERTLRAISLLYNVQNKRTLKS